MAAKRKFTVTSRKLLPATELCKAEVVDLDVPLDADSFEIVDGAAVFKLDGLAFLALAPGSWLRVELVPFGEVDPTRRRT